MEVRVREADWADGRPIRDVHVASIEGLAGTAYDERQVAAWAADHEPADYPIDDRDTHFVVADRGERIVGFGWLEPAADGVFEHPVDGEVTSVFVHPSVAGNGVGRRIYRDLEGRAREWGYRSLGLWAALNAVPFYEAVGFEPVAERTHEFDDGVVGTVLEMRKRLG